MNDRRGAFVTLAPKRQASLFSAPDLRSALERIRTGPETGGARLAVWTDAPPPGQGPDVVVYVPMALWEHRRS